jgi:hypothetical protein
MNKEDYIKTDSSTNPSRLIFDKESYENDLLQKINNLETTLNNLIQALQDGDIIE